MRISGNIPAAAASQTSAATGNEIIDHLAPGDALEAEVTAAKDGVISLRLANGTTVNAHRTAQGGHLPQGTRLAFTVLSKSGGMLAVELTDPSLGTKNLDTEALLRAFGAENTPANRELVLEMVRSGMTPSKQGFMALTNMINAHPALGARQAAFMVAQKMPVTAQNVETFQEFLEKGSQVGEKLSELLDILDAQPSAARTAAEQTQPQRAATASVAGGTHERTAGFGAGVMGAAPEQEIAEASAAAASQAGSPDGLLDEPGLPDQTVRAQIWDGQPEQARQAGEKGSTAKLPGDESAADRLMPGLFKETRTDENGRKTTSVPRRPGGEQSAGAERPESAMSRGTPIEWPENALPLREGREKPEGVWRQDAAVNPPAGALEEKTGDLKEMIRSLFRKIDPERADTLPKELSAQRFLQELDEVVGKLREKSAEMPPETRQVISEAVKDIQRSMGFLEQLNRYTAMVQIPVTINGERSTAELYVFNDGQKGRKRIDPQNATLFLSLRTSHMGRVETFVKVIGKNIECDFRLEDEKQIGLMRGGARELSQLLEAHGFRLARLSSQTTQKPADLFTVRDEREQNKTKYFFDAKV